MTRRIAIAMLLPGIFYAVTSAQPAQSAPGSASTPQTVRLRKGMFLKLETLQALDLATAHAGDPVPLRFKRALYVEGVTLIPAGTLVNGTIVKVTKSGRHCPAGEIVWHLTTITLPDSSVVRTRVRYNANGGDVYVPHNIQDKAGSVGDRVGRGIETTLALPIIAPLLPIAGIHWLARKPVHGCTPYSDNKPLRAHSTVAVEIREDHNVRY